VTAAVERPVLQVFDVGLLRDEDGKPYPGVKLSGNGAAVRAAGALLYRDVVLVPVEEHAALQERRAEVERLQGELAAEGEAVVELERAAEELGPTALLVLDARRERDSALASLARLQDVEARLDEADSDRVAEAINALDDAYGRMDNLEPYVARLVRAVLGLPEVGGG